MSAKHEQLSGEQIEAIKHDVKKAWKEVVENPEENLEDLSVEPYNILFVAGGGLPTQFGTDNDLWKKMDAVAKANDNILQVAGIDFNIEELKLMGDFYRWLKKRGYKLHCIDERLQEDKKHKDCEVHEECGACGAIEAATDFGGSVEELLLQLLGQEKLGKQPLREGMSGVHTAMTIMVDYDGSHILADKVRDKFQELRALTFNASIPLKLIDQWGEDTGGNVDVLLKVLSLWNVQIARNIVAGHNTLEGAAEDTIMIKDVREVGDHFLREKADSYVGSVSVGQIMVID